MNDLNDNGFDFEEFNKKLEKVLSLVKTNSSSYFSVNEPKAKAQLEKFYAVLPLFIEKFKRADSINTSLSTFRKALNHLNDISNKFAFFGSRGRSPEDRTKNVEELFALTDDLLDLFPSICVTETVDDKVLEQLRDIARSELNFDEFNTAAQESLTKLNNVVIQGKRLEEIAAGKVLNNDFFERASKEKKAAYIWTFATVISAVITVGFLIYISVDQLNEAANNTVNYSLLSTKVLITATLGFIAKWTSKRANRHLMEESKYHRLAVNTETLNSFIATLGETEKNLVISTVAIKMFTDFTGSDVATEFESLNLLDLAKTALSKTEKA